MHAFLPGVVLLVRRAKVPVIPVGIAGCFEAWPIHGKPHPAPQFWPTRRGAVAAVIGKPIPPEELLSLKPPEMLARLHAKSPPCASERRSCGGRKGCRHEIWATSDWRTTNLRATGSSTATQPAVVARRSGSESCR